jgi:methionine-R-sulfoxide reductase
LLLIYLKRPFGNTKHRGLNIRSIPDVRPNHAKINYIQMKTQLIIFALLLPFFNSCAQHKKQSMENKPQDTTAITLLEQEWKAKLTPEQYYVLREKGTERAFTGKFYLHKEKGIYRCAACGTALFTHDMKFESHCGWPSFDKEIAGGKIKQHEDLSHGMKRVEITCAKCGGHLGHIFDDGPTKTGQRYCVNSLSLQFEPVQKP